MKVPLLSIIIPTHNSSKTLESCLNSIVQQDYKNYEIWLIDCLSTDETLEIIDKFASKFPQINYVSELDRGIYDAMNKGIKMCRGNWLYFIGSDDTLFSSDTLKLVADKIQITQSKIVYGNVLFIGKNQWNLDNVIFNGKYDLEKMITTNICHQCVFYHHKVFEDYGNYDLKYISSADQEFNLRCFANLTFEYCDTIIANFHVGGFSTTVPDHYFNQNRGAILYKYFRNKIFKKEFTNVRLYLKEAFLNSRHQLKLSQRLLCVLAYIKLKAISLVNS